MSSSDASSIVAYGTTLQFGYLQHDKDKYKYASAEYQFLGWDELTHFEESSYTFMHSRTRRPSMSCLNCNSSIRKLRNKADGSPQWEHSTKSYREKCPAVLPDPKQLEMYKPGPTGLTIFDVPIRVRAASNPGGIGVPYGEVLTPDGWMDIQSMRAGDPVFQVETDGNLTSTNVRWVHCSTGEWIEANLAGLHLAASPGHRVAKAKGVRAGLNTRAATLARHSLVPWRDLPGQATIMRTVKWKGVPLARTYVPRGSGRNLQPTCLSGEQYAAFLGWFLTEGALVHRDKAINISQMKPATRARLQDLLDACGFIYSSNSTGYTMYARGWYHHVHCLNFGLSRDRYVPSAIKNATARELRAFFDAAMDGDGHRVSATSGQFYTISRQFADDMAEIALKLGHIVRISSRQKVNRQGLEWCVSYKVTKSGGTEILTGNHVYNVNTTTKRKSNITRHPASPTYCIAVDSHAYVIRQKGSIWISGGCERSAPPPHRGAGNQHSPAFVGPGGLRSRHCTTTPAASDLRKGPCSLRSSQSAETKNPCPPNAHRDAEGHIDAVQLPGGDQG